jgi:hypothetical protein
VFRVLYKRKFNKKKKRRELARLPLPRGSVQEAAQQQQQQQAF